MSPTRPILRYHGGKWRLAPWIVSHFPEHRIYVEPFGGAAGVLLRKDRSYSEVYNDLNDDVVNLFRVLRSGRSGDLVRAIELTPFSRVEFEQAYEPSKDPLEAARRLIVRSHMGFGSGLAVNRQSTGFRSDSKKSGSTPAQDWARFPLALRQICARLEGVTVENEPADRIFERHDSKQTLFYVDPPYLHETRSKKRSSTTLHHRYLHELTRDDHADLLSRLTRLEGKVVLSGYPDKLYDKALPGWFRHEKTALADGARKRTEVL